MKNTRIPLSEKTFIGPDIARFYEEHARRFMGIIYRRFASMAAKIVPAGGQVLDMGTGSGCLAIELARARPDCRITGIDTSEDMLEIAREKTSRSNLSDNVSFRQASVEAVPFADGYFPLVTSNASLHLWKDPIKALHEMARVTSPGGNCLIWDNLRLNIFNPLMSLTGRVMGMNASQRRMWMQAIRSSYTAAEARAILKQSPLKDARVIVYPGFFELGIIWKKPST